MLPITVFCIVKLGWNHSAFWPSSQVCWNWGSQESRCRSWLYSWEPESLASRGKQRKNRVFSGDPDSVIGLYLSCAPVCILWLRVHLKYTECCGLRGMPHQPWFQHSKVQLHLWNQSSFVPSLNLSFQKGIWLDAHLQASSLTAVVHKLVFLRSYLLLLNEQHVHFWK